MFSDEILQVTVFQMKITNKQLPRTLKRCRKSSQDLLVWSEERI